MVGGPYASSLVVSATPPSKPILASVASPSPGDFSTCSGGGLGNCVIGRMEGANKLAREERNDEAVCANPVEAVWDVPRSGVRERCGAGRGSGSSET